MPVTSNIVTADSLSAASSSEVFRSGSLMMPVSPDQVIPRAAEAWADSPLNWILVSAAVLLFIMFLKQLLAIFPFLFGGLFRWKPLVNLEDSMGMTRYRNSVAGAFVLPFILIASRYELLPIRFAADFEPGLKTLAVLAAFAAYMFLRAIAIEVLVPKKISHDTYRLANRTLYDFLILGGLGQFVGVSVGVAFGLNELTVNRILFYTFIVCFALFLVRRTQILRNECNQFTAFLYLCALEILPMAIVVAVAVFA